MLLVNKITQTISKKAGIRGFQTVITPSRCYNIIRSKAIVSNMCLVLVAARNFAFDVIPPLS